MKKYTYYLNTAKYLAYWVNADNKKEAIREIKRKIEASTGDKVTSAFVAKNVWRS